MSAVSALSAARSSAAPAEGPLIGGVTLDSRAVHPGDLYAALPGARAHGADFGAAAEAAGAAAVLTDVDGRDRLAANGIDLPALVVADPRAVLGGLAATVYGHPAERLRTFGITGTNGKTTTAFLIEGALTALGRRPGLIGTVEIRLAGERVPSVRTTPEAPDLHALLAVLCERGGTDLAMEVSSHALAQHRVDGIVYDVAAFTNLSQDHLDYHATMEAYFEAKAALFTPARARRGVICVDDDWGVRLAGLARAGGLPVTTVRTRAAQPVQGAGEPPADWSVLEQHQDAGRARVRVAGPGVEVWLHCPLSGAFNVANAVLALAALVAGGEQPAAAASALETVAGVPGRMERVALDDPQAPLALVDYAHTPDALDAALAALAGNDRPLVVVFGAGGDRDPGKRPLMGAAAAAGADVVVVTDDNPRSEEPAAIRAAVLAGARAELGGTPARTTRVLEVADRRTAIAEGVAAAWGGGTLLVAGKGHETGQEVAGAVHPFDDRVELRAALVRRAAVRENGQ